MVNGKDKLIVAIDTDNYEKAVELIYSLEDSVDIYKVGLENYIASRGKTIDYLKTKNKKIFLDLKFHDIPRTVAGAAEVALRMGVDMFNVHISGGGEMVEKTVERLKEKAAEGQKVPLALGVTVLTSLNEDNLYRELGVNRPLWQHAEELAAMGQLKGLDGVVASPREAERIRERCGPRFLIVTPGVRPLWAKRQDQKRVLTPAEALKAGADYLVIGSPVTAADAPEEALARILREIP